MVVTAEGVGSGGKDRAAQELAESWLGSCIEKQGDKEVTDVIHRVFPRPVRIPGTRRR